MVIEALETLAAERRIALAYTPAGLRERLASVFAFDQRLGRIVSAATEPMLGQMRLAWWRDELAKPVKGRAKGDAVLQSLSEMFAGEEAALTELVDGWEVLIASERLGADELHRFAMGRSAPMAAVFTVGDHALDERIAIAAQRYAYADAAARLTDAAERQAAVDAGLKLVPPRCKLPSEARGLAVLEALSLRAMRRGGEPVMEGRGAALIALRVGWLGR